MKNKKFLYLIYPLIILIAVLLLSIFHIHGSSAGEYNEIISDHSQDEDLLFGSTRAIRSDEYLVNTPFVISQYLNGNNTVNEDIGIETNLGTQSGITTKNVFSLFKPYTWIFLISGNLEFAFSFSWWIRSALLLIAVYCLLLLLTEKNLKLSIAGSLLFLFAPFVQWWSSFDTITYLSFGLSFFISLIKENKLIKKIPYTLGLSYFVISFGLVLYPAFQVPLAWVAVFLALGILLKRGYFKKENRKNLWKDILMILLCIGIVGVTVFGYMKEFSDVIQLTSNTSYPGQRFISAGQGNFFNLLDGFYNILMQRDSNGAPFGNQCEASNFLLLSVFLIPWILYKNILSFKKSKKIDWVTISLCLGTLFLLAWYLIPLPDTISKYTALYMVLPQRMYIAFGFANILMVVMVFKEKMYEVSSKRDVFFAVITIVVTAVVYYLVGKYLYNMAPQSFFSPSFVSPNFKIWCVAIFTGLLMYFLIVKNNLFLYLLILYSFLSVLWINPLYKGLDIVTDTELANNIQEINADDSQWIVYGDHRLAQYALANGADVINGIHIYPQFELWKIIDPDGLYGDLYNRYSHISFSSYEEGEDYMSLVAMDALLVNVDVCDDRLDPLGIDYVIATEEVNTICLEEVKKENGIEIYRMINASD